MFNPSLRRAFLNQPFTQSTSHSRNCSSPKLCSKPSSTNALISQSFSKTLPRTSCAQSFPQPALLSTNNCRNHSSHNRCSKPSSTSVSLDQSRSTPSSPSLCSQPSSTNAFLNQWLLKSFLAIFCPKLSPATASQTNPSSTDSPLRRPATDSALRRSRPSAETPQRQDAHTPALRRPSAKTPTPQR